MKRHVVPCLIGIVAAVVVLVAFGGNAGTLGFAAIVLLCPLMMLLMMGGMMGMHRHGNDRHRDESDVG